MSEHVLIAPEGDVDRRRHAHLECVQREREAGRFATEHEYRRRTDPPGAGAGIFRRLWRR